MNKIINFLGGLKELFIFGIRIYLDFLNKPWFPLFVLAVIIIFVFSTKSKGGY